MNNMLNEAFEHRRFAAGQVKFNSSSLSDPHIKHILNALAVHLGVSPQEIEQLITKAQAKYTVIAQRAPRLYNTIVQNIIENELFNVLWKKASGFKTNAPQFSQKVFFKLVRAVASENDDAFWPLRSFIDKRPLTPQFEFPTGLDHRIGTAAATPGGTFYFNVDFCQKLMDYSHLKGIKPKGKKYVCNGGDIPDEYCYIEFVIMHEFMHYSEDDFYYQKIIPNADPKIINWVGDFRTNYLLVKSGYEQLPIGLFSDDINYDRQKTYVDMYNIVKDEFEQLDPGEKQQAADALDKQTDDHEPGQEEGAASDATDGKKPTTEDIDKNADRIQKEVEKSKDQAPDERATPKQDAPGPGQGGEPGSGGGGDAKKVDYESIRPTFNWSQMVKRFLATASNKTEETYSKPARRGVAAVSVLAQTGASAIKPAEKTMEFAEAKLFFTFDSSGSMSRIIDTIFANAANLLKQPAFRNTEVVMLNYSDSHRMFKANFSRNKAASVPDFNTKVRQFPLTIRDVMVSDGNGTVVSPVMASEMKQAIGKKWNILWFTDGDIFHGDNWTNFQSVLKASPKQVFVIFDSRDTYISFRQRNGGSTPNITYFA